MNNFNRVVLPLLLAAFAIGGSHSLSLPRVKGGILGQEEVGPIDNYTCTEEGLFPDEDCQYYITCWDKRAVLWRCTDTMLYDLRYNGCDYAENVDCGDRRRPPDYPGTRTPPTTSTTPDPTASTIPPPNGTFDCPGNGVFPHEERCEYYWNCWDGVAFLHKCGGDYLFDLVYDGCNHPYLVECGDRQRPPTAPPTQRTTTTTEREPEPTTEDIPDPTTEKEPEPTTEDIPDPTTEKEPEPTTEGIPDPTTENNPGFQCPQPNGTFPDKSDCTRYYICRNNVPDHETCPDGFHFNPRLLACDWPEEAGCSTN